MVRYSLLFIAGAISVLAFSPFKLWWISIVSLSMLLALQLQCNSQQGFRNGFVYGLGMFGFGTSWIFHSVFDYGQAPFLVAVAVAVVLTLILSLFPALAIWLYTKRSIVKASVFSRISFFVSVWVLIEWLRSWIFTGFPWLLFGHALIDSPFADVIPIFGSFGASAAIAFVSISIIELVRVNFRVSAKWIAGLVVFVAGLFTIQFVQWTSAVSGQPIRVSLIQANIPFAMKWDEDRRGEIYERYAGLTRKNWDSDIIIWPETAIPTFYQVAQQDFLPLFEQEVRNNDSEILSGVFTYEAGSERVFNSLVTIGGETQIYNKQHLVPFGEYMPFRWIFDFLRTVIIIPMSDLSAGEGTSVLTMKGVKVGASICYEAVYGNEIIRAMPQAQLLANVSNDAWFGDSLAPHQHLQIARSRALETGRYLLRATNTGISAIIDPRGAVVSRSGQFTEEVVTGEVRAMHGNTPFIIWGNWGIISIMALVLLLALRGSRSRQVHN